LIGAIGSSLVPSALTSKGREQVLDASGPNTPPKSNWAARSCRRAKVLRISRTATRGKRKTRRPDPIPAERHVRAVRVASQDRIFGWQDDRAVELESDEVGALRRRFLLDGLLVIEAELARLRRGGAGGAVLGGHLDLPAIASEIRLVECFAGERPETLVIGARGLDDVVPGKVIRALPLASVL